VEYKRFVRSQVFKEIKHFFLLFCLALQKRHPTWRVTDVNNRGFLDVWVHGASMDDEEGYQVMR
jgi:hypothetical protein